MERVAPSPILAKLIDAARSLAETNAAEGILLLADTPLDFKEIQKSFAKIKFIVASHIQEVQEAAKLDDIALVPLSHEPQTRQVQVSQSLLEAIADGLLKTGDKVIALYSGF